MHHSVLQAALAAAAKKGAKNHRAQREGVAEEIEQRRPFHAPFSCVGDEGGMGG